MLQWGKPLQEKPQWVIIYVITSKESTNKNLGLMKQ